MHPPPLTTTTTHVPISPPPTHPPTPRPRLGSLCSPANAGAPNGTNNDLADPARTQRSAPVGDAAAAGHHGQHHVEPHHLRATVVEAGSMVCHHVALTLCTARASDRRLTQDAQRIRPPDHPPTLWQPMAGARSTDDLTPAPLGDGSTISQQPVHIGYRLWAAACSLHPRVLVFRHAAAQPQLPPPPSCSHPADVIPPVHPPTTTTKPRRNPQPPMARPSYSSPVPSS